MMWVTWVIIQSLPIIGGEAVPSLCKRFAHTCVTMDRHIDGARVCFADVFEVCKQLIGNRLKGHLWVMMMVKMSV